MICIGGRKIETLSVAKQQWCIFKWFGCRASNEYVIIVNHIVKSG